ncbi:MAG: sugar transferase [Bacillota bacterium]
MRKENRGKLYARYIKRFLDIAVSAAGFILFSPVALLCVLGIKLDDPTGSILFTQERNGKDGKVFRVIKFRTMKKELSGGSVAAYEDTLTPVGKIMRKLSLDEYPQLINILRGDMSLIGPRPLPVRYYGSFNRKELRRFEVRPGLTGLSQINGRANLNWDQRFEMDVEYVDHLSFWMDIKIFLKTIPAVFSHRDVMLDSGTENFDDYRRKQLEQQRINEVRKLLANDNADIFRSKGMGA